MMICSKCGTEVSRGVITFDAQGNPANEYCRVCKPAAHRESAKDIWGGGFELQHVKDENGKNLVVHSTRELREMEKRHGFALAVMSDEGSTASAPPQHESWAGDLSHGYKKKWNRGGDAYSQPEIDKAKKEVGFVEKPTETLVDRPNPV